MSSPFKSELCDPTDESTELSLTPIDTTHLLPTIKHFKRKQYKFEIDTNGNIVLCRGDVFKMTICPTSGEIYYETPMQSVRQFQLSTLPKTLERYYVIVSNIVKSLKEATIVLQLNAIWPSNNVKVTLTFNAMGNYHFTFPNLSASLQSLHSQTIDFTESTNHTTIQIPFRSKQSLEAKHAYDTHIDLIENMIKIVDTILSSHRWRSRKGTITASYDFETKKMKVHRNKSGATKVISKSNEDTKEDSDEPTMASGYSPDKSCASEDTPAHDSLCETGILRYSKAMPKTCAPKWAPNHVKPVQPETEPLSDDEERVIKQNPIKVERSLSHVDEKQNGRNESSFSSVNSHATYTYTDNECTANMTGHMTGESQISQQSGNSTLESCREGQTAEQETTHLF